MKKIIFLIIFFLTFFPTLFSKVNSQIPTGFLIPGQNCGNPIATNAQARKCCYFQSQRISSLNLKIGNPIVDGMVDLFSGFIDAHVLGPVLNPLNELVTKTSQACIDGVPNTPGDISNPNCMCIVPTVSPLQNIMPLCKNIDRSKNDIEYNNCLNCLSGNNGNVGIWTGIGCVYTDTKSLIEETVFRLGIGIAGGFALLCIVYAAFMMQSSEGNPEKLKKAQEMITSCIMGLMLIIFSVFILKLIGVNILKIPGFI